MRGSKPVVVITGASSGIGRVTAHAFATRGAPVVLAARDVQALREVARECEARGGEALPVVTDVNDERAVAELARRAVERFERIDVWVNNAGVMAYGTFENLPVDAFRRIVETNFFGQVNGARVALRQFRAQDRGVLINVASLYAQLTSPYVSAYVASKYGILGFSRCLRQELRDAKDIHVCVVLPEAVDTPIFRNAGNYTGRTLTALPPVVDPRRVARVIVRCARRPRAEVSVGQTARAMVVGQVLLPRLYDRLTPPVMEQLAFHDEPAAPAPGNLFAPLHENAAVSGRFRQERKTARRSIVAAGTVLASACAYALRRQRARAPRLPAALAEASRKLADAQRAAGRG